jgi:hypothetical protein
MIINDEFDAFRSRVREALPEQLLKEHPEFVRRRAAFHEVNARYEKAKTAFAKAISVVGQLEKSLPRLQAEHDDLKARLPELAMQAIEARDSKFTAAVDARRELERIKFEMEARNDALARVRRDIAFGGLQREAESAAFEHTAATDKLNTGLFNARESIVRALARAAWEDTIDELDEWPGRDKAFEFARSLI